MNTLIEHMDEIIKNVRLERHDNMNDLQVIYGYIQLKKYDKLEEFVSKLCLKNNILSSLYNLGDEYLAYTLEESIKKLWAKEIDVDIDIEIKKIERPLFKNNYHKKNEIINKIFSDIEKVIIDSIYVYIYEDFYGLSLLIANSERIINNYENIQKEFVSIDCEDIRLFKLKVEDKIGYRITLD